MYIHLRGVYVYVHVQVHVDVYVCECICIYVNATVNLDEYVHAEHACISVYM